jgi:hypothetical protein
MNRLKLTTASRFKLTTAILIALPTFFAPSLRADDHSKASHLTINQALKVEDTLLPPGEYVFKLTQPDGNHSVVSIYGADGIQLKKVVIGCSVYRANASEKTMFTISQPQPNQTGTLKSWFYRGDNFGVEFPAERPTGEAMVKSKHKGQTGAVADDDSPTRN